MKAMVIAGGIPQTELPDRLREIEIRTVLPDGNENRLAGQLPE